MTTPSKSQTAADYDEWSATYDSVQNRTRDLAASVLRQANLRLTDRTVIEVGCGTGRNTAWLAREASAAEIIALDFSEGMLARAREHVSEDRVRFIQHDLREAWPIDNNSADVVVVMLVLEHVENLKPVFLEAARVLRTDGELFICELHPDRQLRGKKAEFKDAKTGQLKHVEAFLHETDEYLTAGNTAGLRLVGAAGWRGDEDEPAGPPRVLSLHFRKSENRVA